MFIYVLIYASYYVVSCGLFDIFRARPAQPSPRLQKNICYASKLICSPKHTYL